MKIGALVPARIGSKRLPRKNIKELGGKPLICWTLDVLLEASVFSEITVSTESEEVADLVREYYSSTDVRILSRPEELSQDDSSLDDVVRHYLENRLELDWYGLFMPTFPFRKPARIREAVYALATGHPLRVATVSDWEECLMDYYYPVDDGVMRFAHEPALYCRLNFPAYEFRHRDFPESAWKQHGLTINERLYLVHASPRELVDIDTPEDFELASALAAGGCLTLARPQIHDISDFGGWRVVTPHGVPLEPFLQWVGERRLEDRAAPLLVLEEPFPPLSFLRVCDGSVRHYWMGADAASFFNSERLQRSGNMRYIPRHFKHASHYRLLRHCNDQTRPFPMEHDMNGQHAGLDHLPVAWDRVLLMDDLATQSFYKPGLACSPPSGNQP